MRRLVLGIAVAVAALMPAVSMADDQQIADYIKSRLQVEQSKGSLRGFNVDMRVDRGTVWFKGFVATPEQEMLILRTAQKAGHLGVVQVVDDIEVQGSSAVAPAQYQQEAYQQPMQAMQMQPMQMQPMQMPMQQQASPSDYGYGQVAYQQPAMQQPPMPNAMQQQMDASAAINNNSPLAFASAGQEAVSGAPMSMTAGPMAAGGMVNESPNLPGYAWPSYAASPNYAGVSYPQQYSPQAWPYIGPFYPYPQVPLGWRKVSLEWDDGWWQLDFHDK